MVLVDVRVATNDLHRIEQALASKRLSAEVFERCAQDLLSELFPGLSPIPGGTDWGRDADIAGTDDPLPPRLMATSSRTLDGVRKNMLGGIRSMREHGVPFDRLVLANPAQLRLAERQKLVDSARKQSARLDPSDIFDRGHFASRLRRDAYWRGELLGLPSGPISLARRPSDLAEGTWSFLPLVARDDDLAAIQGDDDVILTGPPGVGKSRLVAELNGAAFVDKDAPFEQVAADLRWALPTVVVVDDAGNDAALLRRLIALRHQDHDLFRFRLIAICWPDEVEATRVAASSARSHELELVERGQLNNLLQLMGITGALARAEILDQAEGRPGWAVALADLLLRGDASSLLQGKALLGHVERYLLRAGIGREVIDVLATIAALGEITDVELRDIADEVGRSRTSVATLLGTAARSGLINVANRYSWTDQQDQRVYTVRPPMLADVLVAERGFDIPAPVIDFDGLAARWPSRIGRLAHAAIKAAQLDATGANATADRFFDRALTSGDVDHAVKVNLSTEYLRLGAPAAAKVMDLARASFDEVAGTQDVNGTAIEPVMKLASLAARWYRSRPAIALLLDGCLIDDRPTNSHPGHPLREIEDLVCSFHPEVPRAERLRHEIATVLEQWLARDPDDSARHRVAAAVVQALFSLRLHSAHTDPASPLTWQLIESIVPGEEIDQIYAELWPLTTRLLDAGIAGVVESLIEVSGNWLRIGGGYDRPFGRDHPDDSIAAARRVGEALIAALAARSDLSLGNRLHLRSTAAWHGVDVDVDVPAALEPFFRELDRAEDWRSAEDSLLADLRAIGTSWSSDDPTAVIARLVDLQSEIQTARLEWPDRTGIVCVALADEVRKPVDWLEAAAQLGFMPEGVRFAERALKDGLLSEARAGELLATPLTRVAMMQALLSTPDPPDWATTTALEWLSPEDYRLLQVGFLRDEYCDELIHDLLTKPAPVLRAMSATALFAAERHKSADWTAGNLETAWLDAISHFRAAALPSLPQYETTKLFAFLVARFPDSLASLVVATLDETANENLFRAFPHDTWYLLHTLPAASKWRVWRHFKNRPRAMWFLQERLVGSDIDWLRELIDAGEITPDDALSSFRGFGPQPPMAELAKLLVPRGVDPDRIAGLSFSGGWTGDESARYTAIAESFRPMASDHDPSVQAVGAAGVRIFTEASAAAATKERQQRIRGER